MAEITLKRAVKLRSDLEKKIQELSAEASRLETTTVEKGEEAEMPERTMDEVIADMVGVQDQFEELKDIIRTANVTNTVTWDGQNLSISRAIDQSTRMRMNADRFKNLGKRKKKERQGANRYGVGNPDLFTITIYDPDAWRSAGEKLAREAERLSDLIDEKNLQVTVEIPFAEEYL